MDKVTKELEKLSNKEKAIIKRILIALQKGEFNDFDVKRLKGRDDVFRIRKGKMRIIFRVKEKEVFVLSLERRSDTTYSK
jgi:mRNA-degrading endonuclease RelE of RelBE toxin-antitoxin system